MSVRDVFSAWLTTNEGNVNITEGIVSVDITYGTQVYEGPYQQIDTGQFTIISRNPDLDPKINGNLQFNSIITFRDSRDVEEGKGQIFFLGWVTDFNVEYQRNGDPIITITGTDLFGLYQRTVVTPDLEYFCKGFAVGIQGGPDENGVSLGYLLDIPAWSSNSPGTENYIADSATPGGIDNASLYDNYLNYAPARYLPKVGETYLDILNKYAQTNLNYFSINYRKTGGTLDIYPTAKYNTFYWPPIQDPSLEFPTYNFSSDPADGKPYESILINNNYNRISNSITSSNETRTLENWEVTASPIVSTSTTYGPFVESESQTSYGTTRINLDTIIPSVIANDGDLSRYANDIFQIVAFPSDEIQQITFNNARYEDVQDDTTYSFSQLNQFVRIKHKVNDTKTIDRFYDIAGIRHHITPDKWEMGFTFKPSQQEIAFEYQGQRPTIQMNSLSGDTNFNFTATITNYPTENIEQVFWCLNGTNNNVAQQWYWTVNGERYKNATARNGLTQTWNFDDDGILTPDIPTGGFGAGEWHVIAYIIQNNGWVVTPSVMLTVGTPEVTADFVWQQNLTDNFGRVQFTDDSRNNEVGEPDSYLWDFGDGTATSSERNPIHTYNPAPGETEYDVSLTVFAYGVGGVKVPNTTTKTVTLEQPTMVPDFIWTLNNSTATFTNTSTNVGFEEADAYLWNFGDGTTSTVKNPVKTFPVNEYTPTNFSVTLTTRNIWEQTASSTQTVTVDAINDSGNLPGNQIRLRIDDYTVNKMTEPPTLTGNMYPYMFDFKARTSGTKANLAYLRPTVRSTTGIINWYEADGTIAESSDQYNLTRDSSITPNDQYGLTPYLTIPVGTGTTTSNFALTTTLADPVGYVKDMLLTFRDVGTVNNISYPLTSSYKNTINVEMPDSFGGWVNVGYFPLTGSGRVVDSTIPIGAVTQATKAFIPLRPMPMNIPYFKYTFDNTTATFESMETGTAYAWNFGDGTTSTVKNPVKTFPRKGTYTVTLTVTFVGGGTRTTTEPVIVEAMNPFDVRYVKFVQNYHDGTHAFDTPYVTNFAPFKRNIQQDSQTFGFALNVAKAQTYSMNYVKGTDAAASVINPLTSPYNQYVDFRAQSLDASHLTQWEIVRDYKAPIKNVTDYVTSLYIPTQYGQSPTVAAGINYSVYVTNYTGEPASIGTATWTKVGDITPTALSASVVKDYSTVPS